MSRDSSTSFSLLPFSEAHTLPGGEPIEGRALSRDGIRTGEGEEGGDGERGGVASTICMMFSSLNGNSSLSLRVRRSDAMWSELSICSRILCTARRAL